MKKDTKDYLIAKELDILQEKAKKGEKTSLLDEGSVHRVTVTQEHVEKFEIKIKNQLASLDEATREAVIRHIEIFSTEADNEIKNYTGILSCPPEEQKKACDTVISFASEMESSMGDN